MRKYLLPATVAGAAILSSMSVLASDGTITFAGQLNTSTCTVSAGSAALAVTLPTLPISALASAGTIAGNTPFALSITGCTTTATATTYFEAGANVDSTTGRLKNTGGATNVQLKLTNANGSAIDLSKTSGAQGVTAATVTAGAATPSFAVEYYATGAATAGTVASTVTYSMIYN